MTSAEDTIRRLSCHCAGLQELCRTGTREEAFLLFWLNCKSCILPEWKLQLSFRDFLKSRYYITFSLLYAKNNVWKVQTLLSTLHAYALRKLDFHALWLYHTKARPPVNDHTLTNFEPFNHLRTRPFKLDRKPVYTTPIRSTYFPNTSLIILCDSPAKCSTVTQNY